MRVFYVEKGTGKKAKEMIDQYPSIGQNIKSGAGYAEAYDKIQSVTEYYCEMIVFKNVPRYPE